MKKDVKNSILLLLKKISEVHRCLIEAVSGNIIILSLHQIGQGKEDWETKLNKKDEI